MEAQRRLPATIGAARMLGQMLRKPKFLVPLMVLCAASCTFDPSFTPSWGADVDGTDEGVPTPDLGRDALTGGGDARVDGDTEDASVPTPRDLGSPDLSGDDVARGVDMTATPDGGGDDDAGPAPDASPDMASPPDMDGPLFICNGQPVDPLTDPQHCGACHNACDSLYGECVAGVCECIAGTTACGMDNRCVDVDYDPRHCGACDSECGVGQYCSGGACECRTELTECNGACVDTDTDPNHCGACNNSCNGDVCEDGDCHDRNTCPFGTIPCDMPGGTACLDSRREDLHCNPTFGNSCGTACDGDQLCYDFGITSPPQCAAYRPAIGCTECPCDDCGDGEECFTTSTVPGVAFCLAR